MRFRIFNYTIWLCSLLVLGCFGATKGQATKDQRVLDSIQQQLQKHAENDSLYAMNCWFMARFYDDHNQFDSMQCWINTGIRRLPLNQNQLIHFHYAAFQSIAYYYNGLLQMDLYESMKVLDIAKKLNDSILLTTGYNFMGLANSNIGEFKTAIPYFYEGMKYARQPPFDEKYLVASKPHHLYGNLAEAYYKTAQYDSALSNVYQSLRYATEIKSKRGMAVAKNLLGLVYFKKNQRDSAYFYQTKAYQEGLANNEMDVSLIACAALAQIKLAQQLPEEAHAYLERGFQLKEQFPNINYYFTKQFLDEALAIFNYTQNTQGKLKCLEWSNQNNQRINKVTDQQVVKIILNGIKNENRANELALSESEHQRDIVKMQFIVALVALIATMLFFVLYYFYNKKQLKEIKLRQEISRDLHDDINSTLSSIKLYSELSFQEQQKNSTQALPITHRITKLSADLMSRVSDVIYVLKNEQIRSDMMLTRIKTVVHDLLIAKDIEPLLVIDELALQRIQSPIHIKNMFLIIKEAVNNVAKYSQATQCKITLKTDKENLVLAITDNGKGFQPNQSAQGNGIQNMKYRCEQMNGVFSIKENLPHGTLVQCILPLSTFRY